MEEHKGDNFLGNPHKKYRCKHLIIHTLTQCGHITQNIRTKSSFITDLCF